MFWLTGDALQARADLDRDGCHYGPSMIRWGMAFVLIGGEEPLVVEVDGERIESSQGDGRDS